MMAFKWRTFPWVAYMLATAYHETAYTLAPIKEGGCNDVDGCTTITDENGNVNNRDYGDPTPCPNVGGAARPRALMASGPTLITGAGTSG